jgi:hypothetical protein
MLKINLFWYFSYTKLNICIYYNNILSILYRSPNIARVIRSRRLRWAGHVARMEKGKSALIGKPTGNRPVREVKVKTGGQRTILECTLKK